jgi:NitT/TauT family transport system substrate-binding protein/sulfonate transport system substrate-binding protein
MEQIMKRLKQIFTLLLTAFFVLTAFPVLAEAPFKMKTAWMDEHETFLIWYAKEKGWDKEEGLDIDLSYFDSGMAILAALPAGEWVIAGVGSVPGMMGNLRYDTYTVLIGNDESLTNAVLVRPNSPILKTKGYNKDFPDVYGDPKDVKGKEFLCTTVSSAHFALSHWLNVLGLKDSDVVIKNMDQAQALAAFSTKIGEGVALWAPHMYKGEEQGWKVAGTPKLCKQGLPIDIIAEKKFADQHPELVAKFIRIYLRAVNMLQKEPLENLVTEYCRFFLEWAGKQYSPQMALLDLKTHPVFNYEEQLALFDVSKGPSTAQKWHTEIAKFFTETGRITKDDLKKVGDSKYVTDKFLKMVKTPIPSDK